MDPVEEPENARDDRGKSYFLAWETRLGMTDEALLAAFEVTNIILEEAGQPGGMCITFFPRQGEEGCRVHLMSDDGEAHFGFPPLSFLDGLNRRERVAVMEKGTSRDGWLSAAGTGQGTIITDKGMIDFPVRLFLSVLRGKSSAAIEILDSDDADISAQMCLPRFPSDFRWHPFWNDILRPVVAKHWLLDGQVALISRTDDSQYAW